MKILKINNINFNSQNNERKNRSGKVDFITAGILRAGLATNTFQTRKPVVVNQPPLVLNPVEPADENNMQPVSEEETTYNDTKPENKEVQTFIPQEMQQPAVEEETQEVQMVEMQQQPVEEETETAEDNFNSRIIKSEEEIFANKQANLDFISDRIKNNPRMYSDFGIDEKIEEEFLKLNPDLVKKMDDDVFLSFLLAPDIEAVTSMYDLIANENKDPSIIDRLYDGILRNTKAAKERRKLLRRVDLYKMVGGTVWQEERIERIKKLEEIFTPEDMHKIFSQKAKKTSTELLKWLIGFDIQENHNAILKAIKSSIKVNRR